MASYTKKHKVITATKEVRRKRISYAKVKKLREKLARKQGQICPVCRRDMVLNRLIKTLDHCHQTGYIRGVLCNNCNGLEGKLTTILTRIDRKHLGLNQVMQNLVDYRNPANLFTKWIHPDAETLLEQRDRQRERARTLYKKRKTKKQLTRTKKRN